MENKYDLLIESLPQALIVMAVKNQGQEFIIEEFNKQAEKIENLRKDQVLKKNMLDVFPGIAKNGVLELLQKVYKNEECEQFPQKVYIDDRILGAREGVVFKISSDRVGLLYSDISEGIDISAETTYKNTLLKSSDPVFVIQFNADYFPWRIVEANNAACKLYGYSYTELLKLKPYDLVGASKGGKPTEKEFMEKALEIIRSGKVTFQETNKTKDGISFPVEISCHYFYKCGEKYYTVIVRDLRTRKTNMEKIRFSQTKARLKEIPGTDTGFIAKYTFKDIKYKSNIMRQLVEKAIIFSKTHQSILLQGESGTGKELFASAIHNASNLARGPFVSVNCAALPEALMESELFGYAEGAFTGASKGGKKGKIELANNGTLFLDEIGDMSLSAQALLLRTLQEKEVIRIGDEKVINVNIRLVCATNKNLPELCDIGLFRWDLFYRISTLVLKIPSLVHRKEDIPYLVEHFLDIINQRENKSKSISQKAVDKLLNYNWRGNIRELVNLLEQSYLLCQGDDINEDDLVFIHNSQTNEGIHTLAINMDEQYDKFKYLDNTLKKQKLKAVVEYTKGNLTKAAEVLHVSRTTIYRWLKEEK